MKTDPATFALFDVLDEGSLGGVRPIVGRVIQLNEEIVFGEKGVVDFFGVLDIVDGEIILARQFLEPDLGGVDKWLVNATVLGDGKHAETRGLALSCCGASGHARCHCQDQDPRENIMERISRGSEHVSG